MKLHWLSAAFVGALNVSSRLKQALWRLVYNKIAHRDSSGRFLFMNYGYHDENATSSLPLIAPDEPFRYYIQLYNRVVQDIDLKGKDIVEVGCGRGGGGSFLLRYKNPRLYTGVDLSTAAIDWCTKHHPFANARWIQGLADALPLADNSVDVVVNVESSHCYPSMEKFLSEVMRTLRPGGYLAFCDMRPTSSVESLDAHIAASGLHILNRTEITPQVLHALDLVSDARDAEITSVFPSLFRSAIRDFAAVKDSAIYTMLKTGQMQYLCYLLQKEPNAS